MEKARAEGQNERAKTRKVFASDVLNPPPENLGLVEDKVVVAIEDLGAHFVEFLVDLKERKVDVLDLHNIGIPFTIETAGKWTICNHAAAVAWTAVFLNKDMFEDCPLDVFA